MNGDLDRLVCLPDRKGIKPTSRPSWSPASSNLDLQASALLWVTNQRLSEDRLLQLVLAGPQAASTLQPLEVPSSGLPGAGHMKVSLGPKPEFLPGVSSLGMRVSSCPSP